MRHIATHTVFALLLSLSAAAHAGEGSVRTGLEFAEILSGDSVRYAVVLENLGTNITPDLSHLENDFTVEFGGQNQRVSFGFGQNSVVLEFNYTLTPKRLGKFTITGPTVTVQGRNIKGPDQTLNVIEAPKQDVVLAEITTSAPHVYPTQEFDVILRVFVRPLPDAINRDPVMVLRQSPSLSVNWLAAPDGLNAQSLKDWLGPLVSDTGRGFTFEPTAAVRLVEAFNLTIGMEKHEGLDGQKRDYHVYELKRRFRADKPGTYTFGPAKVKGNFVDGLQQRGYTQQRIRVTTNATSVEVKSVPAQRPANFSGAIGDYKFSSSAAPQNLRVGDPLTLTLTLERGQNAGQLDLVAAPDLTANEKIAADFEIVDKNPTGEAIGSVKKFSYSLRPKRPGVGIPELTASVFDPAKESFVELSAPPIPLKVSEASALNASDIVGSLGQRSGQDLRSADTGIFQNIADVRELKNQLASPAYFGALVGGAWIAALAGCFVIARRRSFASDTAWQRREGARAGAAKKLNEARAASPANAVRHVREAVLGLVADLRNRPAAGFTAADAQRELASAPVELQQKSNRLLEALEAAEYASQGSIDPASFIRQAEELLPELYRALEKSR